MQSPAYRCDNSNISLGERRGISDLARFSLDLSWARAVSDIARSRAYPSPPMSGSSPPLAPKHNPDASDRGHGGYGSIGQEVFRGIQTLQAEHAERSRGAPLRTFPEQQLLPTPYASYRLEDMPSQVQYQQPPRPQMPLPPQPLHAYTSQVPAPFSMGSRTNMEEGPDLSSPKSQRKTKGHVASACVPCKRAHLRCDAQRPCSRCLSNGKEDTCIDVQHKKRGRPRLRDEREPRYEGMGQNYPPMPPSMGRPLSLYAQPEARIDPSFGDLHRTGSVGGGRVLKSQGGGGMYGPIAPRQYQEHPLAADPSMFSGVTSPTPRALPSQEPICAYLNMELEVETATQGFGETIGVQSVVSRKLQDLVSEGDRDKVFRLQRLFEDERREREPNYLPPIYLKYEEDRVIQGVGFGPDEMGRIRTDREETVTFQGPDGGQRSFRIRLGLAKKDSTYFIVVMVVPATPHTFQQTSASPYSRDSYSRGSNRDPQYGYQITPAYQNPSPSSYMQNTPFDPRGDLTYRPPGPLGSNIPPSANFQGFGQPQMQQDYAQGQIQYQVPRSVLPQGPPQGQSQRQRDLQLPPIRDQRGEGSSADPTRQRERDDRGRFDIGGLLEKPGPAGRGR